MGKWVPQPPRHSRRWVDHMYDGSKPQTYNWQMPELDIIKADPSAAIVLNPVIDGEICHSKQPGNQDLFQPEKC